MNKLILCHKSGLECIREFRYQKQDSRLAREATKVLLSKKRHGNQVFDVLVDSQNKKHNNWRYHFHVQKHPIPKQSFIKVSDFISIACPELLLIQLANDLPIEALALLAFEFCGTYSIDPFSGHLHTNVNQAMKAKSFKSYLEQYLNFHTYTKGKKKLQEIVKILADNAASPSEARLYIKLCGDRKFGLFGCKNLEMNKSVKISKEAQRIAGQAIIVPDIIHKKKKVAIEYNSSQFHDNFEQGQKDRRRRDALVYDGWKVHSIVSQHLYDRLTFNLLAKEILHELGQNYRFRGKHFDEKNKAAFKLLS